MTDERRKSVRVPVYMKVINETKEFDFGFAYAKDISVGGVALDTKIFLEKKFRLKCGDRLKIKFKIPNGKLYITALGEIVRIDQDKDGSDIVGLRFSSLEEEFKKEIEVFVSETKKGNISLE